MFLHCLQQIFFLPAKLNATSGVRWEAETPSGGVRQQSLFLPLWEGFKSNQICSTVIFPWSSSWIQYFNQPSSQCKLWMICPFSSTTVRNQQKCADSVRHGTSGLYFVYVCLGSYVHHGNCNCDVKIRLGLPAARSFLSARTLSNSIEMVPTARNQHAHGRLGVKTNTICKGWFAAKSYSRLCFHAIL